jgi:Fe2+ or Zn2+ uptake regulation protein
VARKSIISSALIDLMEDRSRHAWTLEALQAGLATRDIAANFSSIYRAAEKLVTEGAALKVLLDDGRARFELAAPHHDHLHCTRCDALIAVPCVVAGETFATIEARTGVSINEHRVILTGLCPKCRAAELE